MKFLKYFANLESAVIAIVNPSRQTNRSSQCPVCVSKDHLLQIKNDQITVLRKKLRSANRKIHYLDRIKKKLDAALEKLKSNQVIDDELSGALNVLKDDELFRVLHCGVKSGSKYPPNVRHFCLALNYYSPRAYNFIRTTFHYHLPTLETIRNWMANSDICGEPGINAKHLERLTKLAKESKHQRKLMCSLCFDEMNIRQ